ncbi:head-tail adaptor protein [Pseudooceanicola nanhaiensis]|uniref:head-tail adaptor protein n=1 Tax=Pseudooceanicola nanhaiensis TaxID=375761 RepID=UPI001CD6DC9C|nr:head-tail adaptor protein [Pseudooceanicola nanhaiensis]MCA0923003.1 head-tail adaptor protein [Pseudooceanicola nanhaiensis]
MVSNRDLRWSDLDRQVQFRRRETSDDGFTSAAGDFEDLGAPVRAKRTDVSDAERWRAGEVAASVMARFLVRWSPFTAAITPKDRLTFEGQDFAIIGLKEVARRQWIEITGSARADL